MLDQLLRDITLVTLALGLALGWSLVRFASGIAQLVSGVFVNYPDDVLNGSRLYTQGPQTWVVGDRLLIFGPLIQSAIELGLVLLVALLVVRRRRQHDTVVANPS